MPAIFAIIVIVLDQITKYAVRRNFTIGESLPVIKGVFRITYVRNTGAAFSMFEGQKLLTVAIPIVLVATCAYAAYYFWKRRSGRADRLYAFAFASISSGGAGNLIDRIGAGYVTDMFDFQVFPVFNVADIAVTCGCVLLAICVIFIDRPDGKVRAKQR